MIEKDSIDPAGNNATPNNNQKIRPEPPLNPLLFETENFNHAEFLQKQGEKKLLSGESKGLQFFELACKSDPEDHQMLYQQGLSLLEYGSENKTKKYLTLATKKFKAAVKLKNDFFPAWHSLGNTLYLLGTTFKQHHYFLEAKEKFEMAIKHSQEPFTDDLFDLYWTYGTLLEIIADHSGEVSDLNISLEAFGKASLHSEELPAQFWQDYGKVALKLGKHINDARLYMKAVHCHKTAIAQSLSNYTHWFYLADTLAELYALTHDEDHFCQANECFTSAAKLHPQNNQIWLNWARLLLNSGKRLEDPKRLHSCLEKCHRSYHGERKEEILIIWSEALSYLGICSERLDYIYEASNKCTEAEETFGASANTFFAHGITLYAFGKYYKDPDYYYQAIEKFQEGLSIDRSKDELWFQLGRMYAILADLEQDLSLYELANKFFHKAIQIQGKSTYFYENALVLSRLSELDREKNTLRKALLYYEQAFNLQKNAIYLHPEWLFHYAMSLDMMGDLEDDDKYYVKAIEILKRVLVLDPNYKDIHYKIALCYSHLGELSEDEQIYQTAISYFKIAHQTSEENEHLILDWGLALINLASVVSSEDERNSLWKEAEYKFIQSAKLGNIEVYYHMACLYSLMKNYERALYFLEKAESFGSLPPLEEVLEDEWLDNLRQTELFRSFINHLDEA